MIVIFHGFTESVMKGRNYRIVGKRKLYVMLCHQDMQFKVDTTLLQILLGNCLATGDGGNY